MNTKDRFSSHAAQYATFRPTYPKQLYEFVLSHVKERATVWDCACGNGQVTKDLAPYFREVFATDISENQLLQAPPLTNVIYAKSMAEQTAFPPHYFDLITVGQALHWFNIPSFFEEARRVLKPRGVLAVWGYSLLRIDERIDPIVLDFYTRVIGPYWDAERRLVDEQYRTVPFPFHEVTVPHFEFSFEWTLDEWSGYIGTWSSVQKYMKEHGHNPVASLVDQVRPLWVRERMKVSFPLFARVGRS